MKRMVLSSLFILATPSFALATTPMMPDAQQGNLPKPAQAVESATPRPMDAAEALQDLRIPPGNRLERLVGDRAGQYSIRINDQWRICFRWDRGDAYDVEITDYH